MCVLFLKISDMNNEVDSAKNEDADCCEKPKPSSKHRQKKKRTSSRPWLSWALFILGLSFVLTCLFSFLTEISIKNSPASVCIIVLIVLLIINISCDILANAIISSTPEAFHAMASNKIKGAKRAVTFCRNASRLSSIFADVIGDICGIVSGSASTALVVLIAVTSDSTAALLVSIAVSAVIGALTVGGKALFKPFAIKFNKQIVFGFAKFTTFFKKEK